MFFPNSNSTDSTEEKRESPTQYFYFGSTDQLVHGVNLAMPKEEPLDPSMMPIIWLAIKLIPIVIVATSVVMNIFTWWWELGRDYRTTQRFSSPTIVNIIVMLGVWLFSIWYFGERIKRRQSNLEQSKKVQLIDGVITNIVTTKLEDGMRFTVNYRFRSPISDKDLTHTSVFQSDEDVPSLLVGTPVRVKYVDDNHFYAL